MSRRLQTRLIPLVPLVTISAVVLGREATAQCNCTCDGLVPAGQQITQAVMNENGQGPTVHLGFTQSVEVRHANHFVTPQLVTHVCVALQHPSSPPVMGRVFFAVPDANNNFLPASPGYQQDFLINPSVLGGHQLIELTTPQVVTNAYWLGIAYPTAQAGISHQGARPRTAGDAAVYADGVGWEYYDNTGSGFYIGNAPIIRPLTIDQVPVGSCPSGSIVESEPNCGLPTDTINGGCNSTPPVFEPLACGDVFCGGAEFTGIERDTDWFEITLTRTTRIVFTVQANFDPQVLVIEPGAQPTPCQQHTIIESASGTAGTPVTVTRVLGPGTWWLFVAPDFSGQPVPCPALYVATLDCCEGCDPADIPESESCGTDANGGCDTSGNFESVQCNTTICGSLWKDQTGLDVDWYELQVPPAPGGVAFVDVTMVSEFAAEVVLQYPVCPCPLSDPTCMWAAVDGRLVDPCVPEHIQGGVQAPGTYWNRVAPSPASNLDFPCGTTNQYRMTVDVTPCGGGGGAPNDDCSTPDPLGFATVTLDTSIATASGWLEPPCGFTTGAEVDLWYEFIAPCDRPYVFELVPTSGQDLLLAVYDLCPFAGGSPLDCAQSTGGLPAAVSVPGIAGQSYLLRAGAPAGIVGTSDLSVTGTTCAWDLNGDCVVAVQDLLILLGAWGSPYGVTQLLDLLANWGPCP